MNDTQKTTILVHYMNMEGQECIERVSNDLAAVLFSRFLAWGVKVGHYHSPEGQHNEPTDGGYVAVTGKPPPVPECSACQMGGEACHNHR